MMDDVVDVLLDYRLYIGLSYISYIFTLLMCICERVVVVLLPNLPAGWFVLARRIKLQAYTYGV